MTRFVGPYVRRKHNVAAGPRRQATIAFQAVFRPVFERHRSTRSRVGAIDFHDMIDRATDLVEAGRQPEMVPRLQMRSCLHSRVAQKRCSPDPS